MAFDWGPDDWSSRKIYLVAMLAQTLGINTILFMPHQAVASGAAGNAIAYTIVFIVVGIPLMYMECVIGQFTKRDCLQVWHIRSCLSHIGHVHIFWQILVAIYIHTANSFIIHYFLISFEHPIPYYLCGRWSKNDCDILNHNYTVNLDCLKLRDPFPYCRDLCKSFPEYQYWRFNVLGLDKDYFYLPWRVCLATALISILIFLSCFKGIRSLKWFLLVVAIFPVTGRFIFMIGSMLQKGLVVKYEDAMDGDFTVFSEQFSLTHVVSEVLFSINVGSGLAFGCSSRATFRSPCYSNTVIIIVITCVTVILGIASTSMMLCPYAFKYDIRPGTIMDYPITHIFEKVPRLLRAYETYSLWLVLCFSFIGVSAVSLSITFVSSLIEVVSKRNSKVAKNQGLVSFVIANVLFFVTVPLLGNNSLYVVVDMKRTANVITLYLTLIESIVFILWYGLDKFSEDIHFMQGVPPGTPMKACWLISTLLLVYVFGTQVYSLATDKKMSPGTMVGWWVMVICVAYTILVTAGRLLVGLYKRRVYELTRLDPGWGPQSELLRRSRAMFSAQAMTKEYMYRQYHLQAGILMRQKKSNIRSCVKVGWSQQS